jgi:hypothetical protein
METLTDKRCRSRARAVIQRWADAYEQAEILGGAEFWTTVGEIDRRFGAALSKRPITDIEIGKACFEAEQQFTSALRKECRVQQARADTAQSGT